ncbi:MAG: DUF1989 domain-containing protein [Pseudomonadota bacterium]
MDGPIVIRSIENIGHRSERRRFEGFPTPSQTHQTTLAPRSAERLELARGDLLRISYLAQPASLTLMAFGAQGGSALDALGLSTDLTRTPSDMVNKALKGWLAARGISDDAPLPAASLSSAEPEIYVRAASSCTVWIINDVSAEDLISSGGGAQVTLSHSSPAGEIIHPRPLGHILEEFTVKRGTAQSYPLKAGQSVQIIDLEGQQCSDFQALSAAALDRGIEETIDSTATRSLTRRAYPQPGLFDKFYGPEMTPMLRLVQDTCGAHDTFGLACTSRGYEERGFPGHLNCSDNISRALEPYGIQGRAAWPAINFFWSTWIDQHHQMNSEESRSRPGDYVVMEALQDLICVSTACPDDIDPINGWNPTDIHVRIYGPETDIHRAIAYRPKVDAPMQLSTESAFHPRLEKLTTQFAPARNLWAAVSFPSVGTLGEYRACREAVTVQDMSGLRKYDIIGPDATKLLQQVVSRDVIKLAEWRGTYALICDETGSVVDDGTLFHLGAHLYRWCCGSEESLRILHATADTMGLQVRISDQSETLVNLAVQGPKSRDLLRRIVFTQPHVPSLEAMKWFGVTVARLGDRNGAPFMLSRSGYTGELGYEVFCARDDALAIWDALFDAGADFGVTPMGSAALEMIRIEAGLAAAGAEFAPGIDAYEAGLGFAVDLRKPSFTGRGALERRASDVRHPLVGLRFASDEAPASGAPVLMGERKIGHVTSASYAPAFGSAIAMARIAAEYAETGTTLAVGQLDGHMKQLPASVVPIPFVDPKRTRARA